MGTKWTAERHETMRKVWAAKRAARSSRRAPSRTRQQKGLGGSPLSNSIRNALEAQKLVDRIGWDLARKLAERITAEP